MKKLLILFLLLFGVGCAATGVVNDTSYRDFDIVCGEYSITLNKDGATHAFNLCNATLLEQAKENVCEQYVWINDRLIGREVECQSL